MKLTTTRPKRAHGSAAKPNALRAFPGCHRFLSWLNISSAEVGALNRLVGCCSRWLSLSGLAFFAVCGITIQGDDMRNEASLTKEVVLGPFAPQPSFTIYVVADGGAGSAKVAIRRGARPDGDRLMVRAFGPDERLSFWEYAELGTPQAQTPGDVEINNIPLFVPVKPVPGDLLAEFEIPLIGNGVNQIRVTAGACNSLVSITLPRAMPYGVSFQNGTFSAWEGQPAELYAFVPPHAEELCVSKGPLRVADEGGAELLSMVDDKSAQPGKIVIGKAKSMWKFIFPEPAKWSFRAYGFPLILCPTPDAARTIHASVEELPDGTVVCHKFQRWIADLLPKHLAQENVGLAEELIVPVSSRQEEWLKNPLRTSILLSPYSAFSAVEQALRNQNVEPTSHWGGATGSVVGGGTGGWIAMEKLAPPENRWDRYKTIPGLYAGASPQSMDSEALAIAATLDAPCNPYFGKKEILNRAAAAALRDLMALGEDEVWRGGGADSDPYPGFMGFQLGQKTLPAYALVAPRLPPEIRDLWTEGLRHIIDRSYPDGLVSCRNQSSHYLVVYQDFAEGSGDQRYAELAKAYADRFIQGLHPAGFAVESQGPDGTYNGMTHWHMAVYARKSNNPRMIEALKKSYNLFHHTVAPEPDGSMLGASNYGHRTAGSFVQEQWGGGRGILDGVLPEVALWALKMSDEQKSKVEKETASSLSRNLDAPRKPESPGASYPRYLYFEEPKGGAAWPATEGKSFTRNLGGELIAVKRPAYYTAVYVGKPAPDKHYISGKENFRLPYPDDAESKSGEVNARKVTPYLGGGLSLFWTPSYGSSILAMNWAPTAHHGLIATQADGKRYWEDYFSSSYKLSADNSELVVTGRIENQPVSYVRRYTFLDDRIEVSVTLTPEKNVSFASLVENIPVVLGACKKSGPIIVAASEKTPEAVEVKDSRGGGVDIMLDAVLPFRIQKDGLKYGDIQIGRIEIPLPGELAQGRPVSFSYKLIPRL